MTAGSHPPTIEELLVHGDWIWRLARTLVRDDHQADEITQETWIAALRHPPDPGADRAGRRAWLARVVRHAAGRLARSEDRRQQREQAAARSESIPPADRMLQRESVRQHVVEAVLALPEPYRTAVLLRYFEELSPRDVAARLGVKRSTVRSQIQRGLDQLRARLASERDGDRGSWLLALVPLIPKASTPSVPALGSALMSIKTAIAVVSAVGLLACGWWVWRELDASAGELEELVAASGAPQGAVHEESAPRRSDPPLDARQAVASESVAATGTIAEPSPSLRVRVVDEAGLAVRDAEVWIGAEWGEGLSPAGRSGSDGRLEMPRPARDVYVGARHPEHAPSFQVLVRAAAETADDAELELKLPGPGGSCVLTVLDPQSQPLAGARVRFGGESGGSLVSSSGAAGRLAPPWSSTTDLEGRAVATGLAPGPLRVDVRASKFAPWSGSSAIRANEETRFTVTLSLGATVSGRVADANNEGLGGVTVWAGPPEPWAEKVSAETDSSGRYVLEGAPTGEIRVRAWTRDKGEAHEDVVVKDGEHVTWNVLLTADPSLRGRVLDEAGQPLAGWMVAITALGDRGHWLRNGITDTEGRFELPDPSPEAVDLEVYQPELFGLDHMVVAVPGVRPGGEELTVQLRRDQMPTAFIAGRFVYSDGEPCTKGVVSYKASDLPNTFRQAFTESGTFRIGPLSPGVYELCVSEDENSFEKVAEVTAQADSTADLGEIRIARPGTLVLEPTPDVEDETLRCDVSAEDENGVRRSYGSWLGIPEQVSLRPGDYVVRAAGTRYQSEFIKCRVDSGRVTVVSVPLTSRMDLTLDFVTRDAAPVKWVEFEIRGHDDDVLVHQGRAEANELGALTARFELIGGIYTVTAEADNGYRGRLTLSWGGPQTKPIRLTLSKE